MIRSWAGVCRSAASSLAALFALLVVFTASVLPSDAAAGQERYEYDPLGRLVRMIDAQNRVTEYIYDPVGNILEVRTGGTAAAPTVTSIAPLTLRRGASAAITINGTNLTNAQVLATDPQLQISGLTGTATAINFNLAIGATAVLGSSAITVRNAVGQAATAITVLPVLPVASIEPTPLAIPPDNVARGFTVALDHADTIDHTVNVSSDQPTIASVSPASAVIAAGQTRVTFQVTGRLGGQTIIRLSSPTLAATAIPVFVTAEFRGISTAYSRTVGVSLASGAPPAPSSLGLFSKAVGLVKGPAWIDTAPRNFSVGTGGTLSISGVALPVGGVAVALNPATGITLGAVTVSADGTQASVPIAVAADAPFAPRRIIVQAAGQPLVAVQPNASVLNILRAQPDIVSVAPIFGTAGTTIQNFVVRGRNLHDVQSLSFSGGGIVAGVQPTISADGTQLTTGVEISAVAAAGARTVTAVTATGNSGTVATSANTFSVVQTVGDTYANLVSPVVGVNLAGGAAPGQTTGLFALPVGISVGSVVHSVSPPTGATGQSLTLTLNGRELAGVTAVTVTPPTSLTVGTPVAAADGLSVQVPVTIAADAALGLRRLRLQAGTATVPFSAPDGDRFNVTAPLPELVSIDPIVVQAGNLVGVVIRGRNFQGATQVRLTPAANASVGTVGVNAAGDIATVTIAFDAAATAGPRVLTVVTPAGESSLVAGPTNTITVATTPVNSFPALSSPLVGVQLASNAPPPAPVPQFVYAPLVGVQLATNTPPPSTTVPVRSPEVGIALGPVATAVEPLGFNVGTNGSVTVRGSRLPADTVVSFVPATGITLSGAPVVALDGSSVTQAIAVDAAAAQQPRGLRLTSASAGTVRFTPATVDASIAIGPGDPEIISLSAILANQGQTLSLTVRGRNLANVVEVLAEPASGLAFGTNPVVAADGTTVTVQLFIAPDAPLGGRVIRVRTRTGITSAIAAPANTFTVFPP